jgi:hypothetical protein
METSQLNLFIQLIHISNNLKHAKQFKNYITVKIWQELQCIPHL